MTTIQQIEGSDRGDPPPDSSTLVRRCTALRRKPLDRFTAEDLRIMLGQQESVPILLPLAGRERLVAAVDLDRADLPPEVLAAVQCG